MLFLLWRERPALADLPIVPVPLALFRPAKKDPVVVLVNPVMSVTLTSIE
jgi:hypothetical protein